MYSPPPAPLAPRLRCGHPESIPLQGFGVFWSKSGDRYEGEWRDGKRNGKGRQIYGGRFPDGFGGDVYEGDWVQDKRHGQGVMEARPLLAACRPGCSVCTERRAAAQMANGDCFDGEWADDAKHGRGTFYYAKHGGMCVLAAAPRACTPRLTALACADMRASG